MKVTYDWLKDFVDIKIPAPELADKLTMAGLEVKSVEQKQGDFVFEIEITSNRPDWLSVLGVAREVAAITGGKLKNPHQRFAGSRVNKSKAERFSVSIEEKKDCPIYTARIIRGVKVGPSPEWLRKKLELAGLRSVNNVVDITNYVLMELGEPLHAFDLDKLAGPQIKVRRAKSGEELLTIDGQARKLCADILVIADKERPVAIAGVMGGKDTEVTEKTSNVVLEAALFDPVVVRKGRQKLGMSSDASYRFERGIDPQSVASASSRAAELIEQLGKATTIGTESAGAVPARSVKIRLSLTDAKRYLGVDIPAARQKSILEHLGFAVKTEGKNALTVNVPSWRLDVSASIDLIEEIARIFGYENIPATLASVVLKNQRGDSQDVLGYIKNILCGLGLNEVITYSLVERKSLEGFWRDDRALIAVSNPLSLEQEVMRPVLMPSLAARIAFNLRQQSRSIKLFETAKVYTLVSGKVREKYALGLALCGAQSVWFGPQEKHVRDTPGFLHLKGIIATLFARLGITKIDFRFSAADEVEVLIGNNRTGTLKKLSQDTLKQLDIKYNDVFCAEIELEDKVLPLVRLEKRFNPLSVARYPDIARDVTLEIADAVSFESISVAVAGVNEKLLEKVEFSDYYKGEKVPSGFKRLTVSLIYRSHERTLTEEEVAPVHERIVKALQEKFQAKIC